MKSAVPHKYAILSDIHANLEALNAVLADAREQNCTHHAFLGDYVGYCADPKACLDIVREMKAPCIKGNHDEYSSTALPLTDFNPHAAHAIEWTRKQLTDDDRLWLRSLPYTLPIESFTIVHATLDQPQRWQYAFDTLAASSSLRCQSAQLCFFGHIQIPLAFIRDGAQVKGGTYSKFKVDPGKKYFINPGAVGQPRDGIPKASYAIYDLNNQAIELRRVDFDIQETQRKIRIAGLGR